MSEDRDYEIFEVDQHIVAHSKYYAGRMGSRFYLTLRDEKKILGIRCANCERVYWPPRSTCGRCFSQLSEDKMVEIGPRGTVETFTLVTYSEPVHPRKSPFIYGIIRLDGADTSIVHFIDEVEFEKVQIGMRVRPVFAETRNGNILDITHFRPL
ncbi:MAG: Zn-ribbon domain-containing OB-fold protein [Thermodesulfobacteriota bacterium]